MSNKKQKPVAKSKKTSAAVPMVKTAVAKERRPEFELIHFDLKAWIFIGACLFMFFLFVALKWHNSSIPHWSQVVPDGGDPKRGLVAGEPLFIRSDEWLVMTPFLLSQQKNNYPVKNEALGAGETPLILGLPTHHLLSEIRPPLWGYYILDDEGGFAWQWNFKIFPFLIACFLLFMLLTRNHFIISLAGSFWLLLSSAIQWWSINTEVFTFGFLTFISFIYILFSEKPRLIIINTIIFLLSAYSFAVILYPAYQVPYAYFLLALLIGYYIKNKSFLKVRFVNHTTFRMVSLGAGFLALVGLFFLFYMESKETIALIANTVYPGMRSEQGGEFPILKIFADNFSQFMNIKTYPPNWGNICEASSFLMLAPMMMIALIAEWIKVKKIDPLLCAILAFQFLAAFWMFVGLPDFVAKLTLFSTSPSYRTFFVFGFTNIIMAILFLRYYHNTLLTKNKIAQATSLMGIFIVVYGINYLLNKQAEFFFTTSQVLKATIIFTLINWLIIFFNENKWYQFAFYTLGAFLLMPNAKINPLSKGLSPFYDNAVYKFVAGINAKDPGAEWVVFGAFTYADFLKAAGINCFNGVQFAPPLDKLKYLDPEMKKDSIYNRYAHIDFYTYINADSVKIELIQNDRYSIKVDPCSPRLVQMGIKYILFTYQPQPIEVDCMTPIGDTNGVYVYKRNEL
ncbi:MAG: hypothetical protein ABJB16_15915 [Saprospiraceae bacterium]